MIDRPQSPTESTSPADAIAFYKAQYESLERELADFQESSKELEAELERDVEAAEKRERTLKSKAEELGFEVDEWKTKYKQSKTEAGTAQAALQKEVTQLRELNRELSLKLRDIEVANDDFEKQARNTTSSMEDLESKLNMAIERAVLLEEEMRQGEQEREKLRIETQRLRDELSELKVEADVMQDKLRKASGPLTPVQVARVARVARVAPRLVELTPSSTISSPLISSPASTPSTIVNPTPPPRANPKPFVRPKPPPPTTTPLKSNKLRRPSTDFTRPTTPRQPVPLKTRTLPRSRPPLNAVNAVPSVPVAPTTPQAAFNPSKSHKITLPHSEALVHIRNLTVQMQRLEQRVQSARSKLPAPTHMSPRALPRPDGAATRIVHGGDPKSSVVAASTNISSSLSAPGDIIVQRTRHAPVESRRPGSEANWVEDELGLFWRPQVDGAEDDESENVVEDEAVIGGGDHEDASTRDSISSEDIHTKTQMSLSGAVDGPTEMERDNAKTWKSREDLGGRGFGNGDRVKSIVRSRVLSEVGESF